MLKHSSPSMDTMASVTLCWTCGSSSRNKGGGGSGEVCCGGWSSKGNFVCSQHSAGLGSSNRSVGPGQRGAYTHRGSAAAQLGPAKARTLCSRVLAAAGARPGYRYSWITSALLPTSLLPTSEVLTACNRVQQKPLECLAAAGPGHQQQQCARNSPPAAARPHGSVCGWPC